MIVANYGDEDLLEDELDGMGMTVEMFQSMLKSDLISQQLSEIYLGEGGKALPSEAEIRTKFDETYLRAKHVLVSTVGDDGALLENQDELEALANDIADRAQSGEDFDALIAEYGEDPGMTMEENADGYIFTEGAMVDAFYQGTLALDMDGISEPIASDYGWHIIQRLPLRDSDYEAMYDTVLSTIVSFETLFTEWAQDCNAKSEDILATLTDAQLVALGQELVD